MTKAQVDRQKARLKAWLDSVPEKQKAWEDRIREMEKSLPAEAPRKPKRKAKT